MKDPCPKCRSRQVRVESPWDDHTARLLCAKCGAFIKMVPWDSGKPKRPKKKKGVQLELFDQATLEGAQTVPHSRSGDAQ